MVGKLSWWLLTSVSLCFASDIGYERLFESSVDEVNRQCVKIDPLLDFLKGSFLLPSIAQYGIGKEVFRGTFDGYGKLQRFEFLDGNLCTQSKMLRSLFYNSSVEQNTIVPELLFLDSVPSNNYSGVEKFFEGPNDNNMVNSYELGGKVRMLSDSPLFLEIDLHTLEVQDTFMYNDMMVTGLPYGSAHPIKRSSNGCMINVANWQSINDRRHLSRAGVSIYESCPDLPNERTELNAYECDFNPYLHSFGLTENFAIIPHQNTYVDLAEYLRNGTNFMDAYMNVERDEFLMQIVPLNGEEIVTFTFHEKLYYVHVVNAFEFEDGVVIDMGTFDSNPFAGGVVSLEWQRNRYQRNTETNNGVIKRYVMYTSGDHKGKYDVLQLSLSAKSTEFPNINHDYASFKYCYFYAVEWFHDSKNYGSMAIVKYTLCDSKSQSHSPHVDAVDNAQLYWNKENYYPSEPTFVPSDTPQGEDDGVLIFTALDGVSMESILVVVDARTMDTLQEIKIPLRMTFTTHGQWYPDVVGS